MSPSSFPDGTPPPSPPVQVRAVPYWVDDESVRASMIASASDGPILPKVKAIEAAGPSDKPRVHKPST